MRFLPHGYRILLLRKAKQAWGIQTSCLLFFCEYLKQSSVLARTAVGKCDTTVTQSVFTLL